MAKRKPRPVFWRRGDPNQQNDIALLLPASLPKNQRFETPSDTREESKRSQKLLRSFNGANSDDLRKYLRKCRAGNYHCDKPYCPICARDFRRWFIGELLRVTQARGSIHIFTILLEAAKRRRIDHLDPRNYPALLRKRLDRAGLANVPAIGGFEIIYRAKEKRWILHINLLLLGGDKKPLEEFRSSFDTSELDRPIVYAPVKDRPEQLSYLLKFVTYHRPFKQVGPSKSPAKPLNAREHHALVDWMAQFRFQDFLFLFNARREGAKIELRDDDN